MNRSKKQQLCHHSWKLFYLLKFVATIAKYKDFK